MYKLIKDRLLTEQLPAMQIDGSIEFKPCPEPVVSNSLPPLTVQNVAETNVVIHTKSPTNTPGKV